METERSNDLVLVELPLPFVHGLLTLMHPMDKRVINSLRSALEEHQRSPKAPEPKTPPSASSAKRISPLTRDTNLSAEILGDRVSATTLPGLFAKCVDMIHGLDPSAIERLAGKKTHARRYVARRREDVHLKSPHLPTMKTGSGWWISANVGEKQVTKAMRLLAEAADLQFGKDFIYPL